MGVRTGPRCEPSGFRLGNAPGLFTVKGTDPERMVNIALDIAGPVLDWGHGARVRRLCQLISATSFLREAQGAKRMSIDQNDPCPWDDTPIDKDPVVIPFDQSAKEKVKGKGKGSKGSGARDVPAEERLTAKQEAFVRAILRGAGSHSEAYREAYETDGMSKSTIHREAFNVMENPKVAARIKAGQAVIAGKISRTEASRRDLVLERLEKFGKDGSTATGPMVAATVALAKTIPGLMSDTTRTIDETPAEPAEILAEIEQRLNRLAKPA